MIPWRQLSLEGAGSTANVLREFSLPGRFAGKGKEAHLSGMLLRKSPNSYSVAVAVAVAVAIGGGEGEVAAAVTVEIAVAVAVISDDDNVKEIIENTTSDCVELGCGQFDRLKDVLHCSTPNPGYQDSPSGSCRHRDSQL
jgi:hypothetical protein